MPQAARGNEWTAFVIHTGQRDAFHNYGGKFEAQLATQGLHGQFASASFFQYSLKVVGADAIVTETIEEIVNHSLIKINAQLSCALADDHRLANCAVCVQHGQAQVLNAFLR